MLMSIVVPLASLTQLGNILIGALNWASSKWHLYTNNLTPSPSSVIGDFVELAAAGYAPALCGYSFEENPNGYGDAWAGSQQGETQTSGAGLPVDVYGWYVTDATGAVLLAAGRFDTTVTFANANDTIYWFPGLGLNWQAADPRVPDVMPDGINRAFWGTMLLGGSAIVL